MIGIFSNPNRNLDNLAKEHYQGLKTILKKRINAIKRKAWLKSFLTINLEEIIIGSPSALNKLCIKYKKEVAKSGNKITDIQKVLMNIFDYEAFIRNKNKSYALAQKLQVNCCPYCNRNYTVTVIEKNRGTIVRPDFDHFFPKSKFPLLALSFYNLIPSCALCNRSIKRDQEMVYRRYIHPYEEGFDTVFRFNFKALDTDSAIGIKSNLELMPLVNKTNKIKANRCENNYKLFKLKQIYEVSHLGEISDLIRKYHTSGGRYIEILHSSFPGLGTIEELYKIAFGNFFNDQDFEKRPLSKLTKDIVEQLQFYTPNIP